MVTMHVTDWATAQKEDPELAAVFEWLANKKSKELKTLLKDRAKDPEGLAVLRNRQNFTIRNGLLYLSTKPQGEAEKVLCFVVPWVHRTAALNGCH